jgi:MSHA pilin protein MshD
MLNSDKQSGATLVELVVSIVILSILSIGIMSVISSTALGSAKPLIRTQAIAIARSYMEEILSRPLSDPAGGDGEVSRSLFDDVDDYHNLADNSGAEDRLENPVAGLEGYNVSVAVVDATISGLSGKKITVTVTHDSGTVNVPVTAYRFN